jgi:hypothetical protein
MAHILLLWFLLMLIQYIMGNCLAIAFVGTIMCSSFLHLLANLTNLSKYSSFHGMVNLVSIGVRDILPLMKCVKILDSIIDFFSKLIPTSFVATLTLGSRPRQGLTRVAG